MRKELTEQLIAQRIEDLCRNFRVYLARFDSEERFAGPSLYFHQRTIQCRRELGDPLAAIKDECFREYLYATLAAWGLVRMGGVKMHDFNDFTKSLKRSAHEIQDLDGLQIESLSDRDVPPVAESICTIIGQLEITEARAKLVANTKALHHLLPELVPPIDRKHIGWFFGWQSRMQAHQQPFMDMFPRFCHIARRVSPSQYVERTEWCTSQTKVLDNAILGFSLSHRERGKL